MNTKTTNLKYMTLAAAALMAAGAALPAMAQTNGMSNNGAVKTSSMTTGKTKAVKHVSAKKGGHKQVAKKSV